MTTPNDKTIPLDTTQTCILTSRFGLPRQSRELKNVSKEAEQKANAAVGSVRSSLFYWKWDEGKTKHDGLEPLKKVQGAMKAGVEHFARFPLSSGVRILPAALVAQCVKVKDQFMAEADKIFKDWFTAKYPELKASAAKRMGAFYSEQDFPSLDECMDAFTCEVTILPLASAEQWKHIALVAPDLAAAQEKSTTEAYAKGLKEAHEKLWDEIMEPIQHAVTVLQKDKGKIYETLLGNIMSIVDLVPAYNGILKDDKLAEVAAAAKKAFSEISTEDLRNSAEKKAQALKSAESILTTFKPFARKLAV